VRNRRGLNRIGILAIALIIALGAVGVTYSAWTDEVYITGYLTTSNINTALECGDCSPDSGDSYIACTPATNLTKLNISVTDAQFGTDYNCEFTVINAVNSFDVTVTGLSLSGSYPEVTADIEDLTVGAVISQDSSVTGNVHIQLTDHDSEGDDLLYTLTVIVH